jgi:hypothetical protein
MTKRSPFRYFKMSPEVIRLAVKNTLQPIRRQLTRRFYTTRIFMVSTGDSWRPLLAVAASGR